MRFSAKKTSEVNPTGVYPLDEEDIKSLILPVLTTGDLKTGFFCPDMDEIIDSKSEEELSKLLDKGIRLQKRCMI